MKKTLLYMTIISTIIPLSIFSINLNFDNTLFLGSNSGMQNNYDNLYFQYGGNILGGTIFWKGTQPVPATSIVFGSQTITGCTQRLQGAYYNPARGNRLRPLDPDTLNQRVLTETVLNLPATYAQLGLTGGLYTNCTGNPNNIYGYIRHTRSGSTDFHLIAGSTLNFNNNTFTNSPASTLQININTLNANGYVFDPLGGIGEIGVPPVCGNGSIEVGEICDDGNTTNGDGCSSTCQIQAGRSCTGQPSQCTQTNQGTGTFNAWLQFPSLYTNSVFVNGLVYVTEPAGYIIQGNTQGTFAGTLAQSEYKDIILTTGEGLKTLTTTFTSLGNGVIITGTTQITLDLTPPTLNINSPISGTTITGNIIATRTAQDTHGITSALIQVYQGNTLVYSNTSTTNSQTINTLADGSYTLSITVYDNAANSTTQSIPFTLTNSTIPSNRSITGFNHITGADLYTIYISNPIIIAGLPTGAVVTGTVNTGVLIKNNIDVGVSTGFSNGDILRIALRSATGYNTTRTTQLNINNSVIPFSVTTKMSPNDTGTTSSYCLSTNQYALIFLGMKNAYGDNETRFTDALRLMRSIIRDIITITANQGGGQSMYALECFATIIDNYLNSANTIPPTNNPNQWIYIAPNGKQYRVEYLPDIDGYTSPDFQYRKIFVNYETFTKHIDSNNPKTTSRNHIVDPNFTPIVHTAPNGKRYTIQKTNRGFMSYQFIIPTYFQTEERIKAHINRHNPK